MKDESKRKGQRTNNQGEKNMRLQLKNVKTCLIYSLLIIMLFLQGCTLREAQTTIQVTQSDDKRKLQVELKADTSQNYEWKYYTQNGLISESTLPENTSDQFSTTYITRYRFTAHDEGTDTIYFILIKDGDLETAKAYAYEVTVDENAAIRISSPTEMTINLYPEIMERVKEL